MDLDGISLALSLASTALSLYVLWRTRRRRPEVGRPREALRGKGDRPVQGHRLGASSPDPYILPPRNEPAMTAAYEKIQLERHGPRSAGGDLPNP